MQFAMRRNVLFLRLFRLNPNPGKISRETDRNLIGNEETIRALAAGVDPVIIRQRQQDAIQPFLEMREKYLLYR